MGAVCDRWGRSASLDGGTIRGGTASTAGAAHPLRAWFEGEAAQGPAPTPRPRDRGGTPSSGEAAPGDPASSDVDPSPPSTRLPTLDARVPLRLLQVTAPSDEADLLDEALEEAEVSARWQDVRGGTEVVQLLLQAEEAEPVMDRLQERLGDRDGFRIVLLPVEAAVPALEEPESKDESEAEGEDPKKGAAGRVSRAELLLEASSNSRASGVYVALVVASTVVAAVGLLKDDIAVIIGAMVIAPLLGPNVALSLATTLREVDLARQALVTNAVGMGVALAVSVAAGFLVEVDPTIPSIAARTAPGFPDILLALSAGVAGTLAFTSGYPQTVIGVMVAVALLPPLVCFGLLLGAGLLAQAAGAFLLVSANIISVNLAGVGTFLARGVRPNEWWEARKARRTTLLMGGLWAALLALLVLILYLARRGEVGPFAL